MEATPALSASAERQTARARVVPLAVAVLALWLPFGVLALCAASLRGWLLANLPFLPGVSISMSWLGVDDSNRWVTGGVTLALVVGVWLVARRRPVVAAVIGLAAGSFVALHVYALSLT